MKTRKLASTPPNIFLAPAQFRTRDAMASRGSAFGNALSGGSELVPNTNHFDDDTLHSGAPFAAFVAGISGEKTGDESHTRGAVSFCIFGVS